MVGQLQRPVRLTIEWWKHLTDTASLGENDLFNVHFGVSPPVLTVDSIEASVKGEWSMEKTVLKGFGRAVELKLGKQKAAESFDGMSTRVSAFHWALVFRV